MPEANSGSFIMALGTLFVCVCAILASYGYKGRVTTVGIDLGTTYSVVGINRNGKVEIIPDKLGNTIFPSVVSYLDNGKILVGYDAVPMLTQRPASTIYNSKRFIGRKLDTEDNREKTVHYASTHPFKIVYPVNSSVSEYSPIAFEVLATGHPALISPEMVGSSVLKYLLGLTADYLGHTQVTKAIIAVPAKFTMEQRAATGAAYKAAGLKVIRVLEEPTAAAIAYDLHKKPDVHHIIVYDFGGGTLDVSLLHVAKQSVQVYASDGDDELGGSDLDVCLGEYLSEMLNALSNNNVITVSSGHSSNINNVNLNEIMNDSETHYIYSADIRKAAERAKILLSTSSNVRVHIVMNNKSELEEIEMESKSEVVVVPSIESRRVTLTVEVVDDDYNNSSSSKSSSSSESSSDVFLVSRPSFEHACSNVFDRALEPVSRLLEEMDMPTEDVDEVVLVGGTTRIPFVKQMLRTFFSKELNDHIDPDITVAYGAASVLQ
jgi:molecular chaperone DnaK (HSP70)